MGDFIDDIRQNPVVLAVGAIVLVLLIVLFHKKVSTGTAVPATLQDTASDNNLATASGNPVSYPPANNVTNVYPVTQVPVPVPTGATPPGLPTPPASQHISPSPKGTAGMSDNFWVYTTSSTDTLQHINDVVGGWSKYGTGYLIGYRNNAQVLQSWGVDLGNTSKPLPSGIKLSV